MFAERRVIPDHVNREGPHTAKAFGRLWSGLNGDVCQHSIVLKHLARYRPHWIIDVRTQKGTDSALFGLCNRVITTDEEEREGIYDTEMDLHLYEHYIHATDRPYTKVSCVLQRVFQIYNYDADLGRYECRVSDRTLHRAMRYLRSCSEMAGDKYLAVLIHYQGCSSTQKKNLADWQATELCEMVIRAGRTPIILDMQGKSPLIDQKRIFSPVVGKEDIWGSFGNGDAATIAGLVRGCEAYIGIDSGPGKLASTTDTPTLICWTHHHPLQYHDPAPNTMHLVPDNWRSMAPIEDDGAMADFFVNNYQFFPYTGEHGLVAQAMAWLAMTLGTDDTATGIQFVIPPSRQSALWAMSKIRGVAAGRPIDVIVAGDLRLPQEQQTARFVEQFSFVRSVRIENVPIIHSLEEPVDSFGRRRYVSDGLRDNYHFLMPDRVIEAGRPLKDWLPDVPLDWGVVDHFEG